MRLIFRHSVLCLFLVSALPVAAADFSPVSTYSFTWEGVFIAGRLSALGDSDLADSSPAALLVNPAPLAVGNGVGLSYDHADYFLDAEFHTYAGAAEWNDWRLNIAVQDFVIDSALVRTAYNPEGTGETFDVRDRMTAIGLSYDLGHALTEGHSFRWSIGAAWRRFSATFEETEAIGNSLDLGTTFSWRTEYEVGWTGLTGAVSWQNVTDAAYTFDERQASLPRPLRTGLTVETAFEQAGHSADLFKLLLAYSRAFQIGKTYRADSDHVGLEVLFLNALALRYGHSTRVAGGISSWGTGIVLDGRLMGPFTVEVDLGEMSYDNQVLSGEKTILGARARYNF